jgi:hypothetical protein
MPNIASCDVRVSGTEHATTARISVGLVCDLLEEDWPSMDLVGDMLLGHLKDIQPGAIEAACIRPPMLRRFSSQARQSSRRAFNADRVINRFWDYPRYLRRYKSAFDVFHLIDHSYAQLVLELPAERTVVTCHDIDTFRCLLEPPQEKAIILVSSNGSANAFRFAGRRRRGLP